MIKVMNHFLIIQSRRFGVTTREYENIFYPQLAANITL